MSDLESLVAMQRHRDAWRRYAYGRGPRPSDFLDSNLCPCDRGPTSIERAVALLQESSGVPLFSLTDDWLDRRDAFLETHAPLVEKAR